MSCITQESALHLLTRKYGETAFTEEHVYYKLVGLLNGSKRVFCVADTWESAMYKLARKAGQL